MSNHQSHIQISKEYECGFDTCRYWLQENVKRSKNQRTHDADVPYSKSGSKRIKYRKTYVRTAMDIRRNPDIYLDEIFPDADTAFSLDEITDKLHSLTGIMLRNKTLLKAVHQYEKKTGIQILEKEVKEQNKILYRMV